MKKLLLIGAVFALAAGVAFGQASQELVTVGTDLTGTDDGTTDGAILYASFSVCGVSYTIITDDEWAVGAHTTGGVCISPGEEVIQDAANNFTIENTGGVAIDLGFEINDQDDLDDWTMTGTIIGTAPATIDQYTLALLVMDPGSGPPAATEFGAEDILQVDEAALPNPVGRFYDITNGYFRPATAGRYHNEGSSGLNLWAGPGTDDKVDVHLYFQMGSAGASDTAVHTVTINVGGQVTTG